MQMVITGCHHQVDFGDFSERVYLQVQVGGLETQIETTEEGMQAIFEIAKAAKELEDEPEAPRSTTTTLREVGQLDEIPSAEDFDEDGVAPFGFGEEDRG